MKNKRSVLIPLIWVLILFNACQNNDETIVDIIKLPDLATSVEIYKVGQFQDGYTLLAPMPSKNTYLIDMEGYVVNKWESEYNPNNSVYLLEDGSLLRTENLDNNYVFTGRGGLGGRLAKYSFEGELKWTWNYSSDEFSQHHDIELLPNGNILVIAWEIKSEQEVLQAGKEPENINLNGIWPDHVIEIKPNGTSGATIVWEWHQWDHMIQDFDPTKDSYGNVAEQPELIDINYSRSTDMDIAHLNGIEYIEEHDLIILSAHHYNEFWIIDHSTTTEEAASHEGGKRGKGGDLIYRWGNPLAYKTGSESDQMSFLQHNPEWLNNRPSNGGNLTFFNNGDGNKGREYSTVDEIQLPINSNGDFELLPNVINGPTTISWRFEQENFSSPIISGAQRLENKNTLICEGIKGILHEVTVNNETVWKYKLPTEIKSIFRANRYPKNYSAFSGKAMKRLNVKVE